ncbi:hypothetical protein V8C34DRAFT_318837 [Trichoderma compactum]
MSQAQAQMVMCNANTRILQTWKENFQQRMDAKACLVWEITNSSSASSTTSATQSSVDIGQKGGGSKEGQAKGLGWRYGSGSPCEAHPDAGFQLVLKPSTCNGGGSPEYLHTYRYRYRCVGPSLASQRTGLVPRSQTPGGSGTAGGLTGEDTGTEMYLYLLLRHSKTCNGPKSPRRCEEDANSSLCVPMTGAKRHWQKSLAYSTGARRRSSANQISIHSNPAHKCDRRREIEAGPKITAARR